MARRRGVVATLIQMQREAERERERRARAAASYQRNVQRAASATARAQLADQRLRERLYAEAKTAEAAEDTAQIEGEVEALRELLSATLGVDDYLDLNSLKRAPEVPTFDPSVVGVLPPPPTLEAFLPATPSGVGRMLGRGAKHAEQARQGHVAFEHATDGYQREAQQHAVQLEAARREHDAQVAQLMGDHQRRTADIDNLQRGISAGQPDAVIRYLDLVLEAARYPEGFPHRWKLAYTPESGQLVVDYALPLPDVVPKIKGFRYVKTSGAITPTARPQTQIRALYTSVVAQTALRVVHEILESDRRASIRTVVLNGYTECIDPATGRESRSCLVALATSRARFLQLNLARIDPISCLTHLEGRLSKDPTRLVPVEPIVLTGTLDVRHTMDTDDDINVSAPQSLVAGQNVGLTGPLLSLRLTNTSGDLSVLMLGPDGKVARDEDFIFYNNPSSTDGAVLLHGGENPDAATVDLSRLLGDYERVALVASTSDPTSSVAGASLTIIDPTGEPGEFAFTPTDRTHVKAIVCAELYRRREEWRLRAVGQGWGDGLAGLARDYGVDVS